MQPLKAHVKDGKLVFDDPDTDLPEGEVVVLLNGHHLHPGSRAGMSIIPLLCYRSVMPTALTQAKLLIAA